MFLYQNKMSTFLKKKWFYFIFYFTKNQYFATGNWLLSVWHSRSPFFLVLWFLSPTKALQWFLGLHYNREREPKDWHNWKSTCKKYQFIKYHTSWHNFIISFEVKLFIGQNFDILICSKYFHNFKLPLNRKMRVNSSHYDSS